MTTTEIATTTDNPEIRMVPLQALHECPFNPRKVFKGIDELAADIAEHGVLQPITARPNKDGLEIVFGARRYRASVVAAKKHGAERQMPVIVRELDDARALELMIVENGQRDDVHPLEEAEGYEMLHKKHGYDVDRIAAKVGKSRAYVYARMKLLALSPEARKAFLNGKLTASTALYVARIPVAKLQNEAVQEITRVDHDGDAPSARAAFDIIEKGYMLRLAEAPFNRADTGLVPAAGSCGTCPKRTGNQAELFDDVKSPDVCTDPICFRQKVDADSAKKIAEAKKAGLDVLEGKRAAAVFQKTYGDERSARKLGTFLRHDAKYVDVDDQRYDVAGAPTVKALLKKVGASTPPVAVAIDGAGRVRELVSKAHLDQLYKAAGAKKSSSGYGERSPADKARAKKEAAAAKKRKAIERASVTLLVEAVEKKAPTLEQWRCLAHAAISAAWHDSRVEARYRRGLHDGTAKGNAEGDLVKHTAKMTEPELRGVVVEMLAYPSTRAGLCKAFGVKPGAVSKRMKADAVKPATKKTAKVATQRRMRTPQ